MGYVYAGSLRAALVVVGVPSAAVVLACVWTFAHPPGVYGFLSLTVPGAIAAAGAGWSLAIALGFHAALLCRRPRSWLASGSRLWLTAIGIWMSPLALGLMVRWVGPVAVYSVSSGSMAPTLQVGDFVWASGARASCGGQRVRQGDVVMFRRGGRIYVSRAIAGPGQIIALQAGRLSVDGKPMLRRQVGVRYGSPDEGAPLERLVIETLSDGARYTIQEFQDQPPQDELRPTRVPPSSWFVLGDNRDNSLDSRFKGPIREDDICGIARKIVYSRNAARIGARP